jgi:hypothetical protein
MRWLALLAAIAAAAGAEPSRKQTPPNLMLWAWERATDLRFIKPAEAGVAYHIANLELESNGTVSPYVRRQPLLTPPGTFLMPVVRIDIQGSSKPPLSTAQRTEAAQLIVEALRLSKANTLQIDFDAPQSAWPFYRALLADVRRRVGPSIFISMTALISWCGGYSWMTQLPVDEIVPMVFRTGWPSSRLPEQFAFPACRSSIGVSLDTEHRPVKDARRVYAFPGYSTKLGCKEARRTSQ